MTCVDDAIVAEPHARPNEATHDKLLGRRTVGISRYAESMIFGRILVFGVRLSPSTVNRFRTKQPILVHGLGINLSAPMVVLPSIRRSAIIYLNGRHIPSVQAASLRLPRNMHRTHRRSDADGGKFESGSERPPPSNLVRPSLSSSSSSTLCLPIPKRTILDPSHLAKHDHTCRHPRIVRKNIRLTCHCYILSAN